MLKTSFSAEGEHIWPSCWTSMMRTWEKGGGALSAPDRHLPIRQNHPSVEAPAMERPVTTAEWPLIGPGGGAAESLGSGSHPAPQPDQYPA